MSNGLLGKAMTQIGSNVTVYAVPATGVIFASVVFSAVNTGTADGKLRIAVTTQAATPNPEDYVEYDAILPANGGVYDRTCLPVSPGEKVMIFSDVSTIAFRVSGLEEAAA